MAKRPVLRTQPIPANRLVLAVPPSGVWQESRGLQGDASLAAADGQEAGWAVVRQRHD